MSLDQLKHLATELAYKENRDSEKFYRLRTYFNARKSLFLKLLFISL